MPSMRYRVCLPAPLGECVEEVSEATGRPLSAVIRKCVELALSSPELQVLLRAEGPPVIVDTRTPAQIAAWEDYQKRYQPSPFDPATILTWASHL
jgi:hypothetical protein